MGKTDSAFAFLYSESDSSGFFMRFISAQDEAVSLWSSEDNSQPVLIQQSLPKKECTQGLFAGQPISDNLNPISRNQTNADWVTGVFLITLILISWVWIGFRKRLVQIFRAAFSFRFVNQLLREGNLTSETVNTLLSIGFLMVVSLLVLFTGHELAGLTLDSSQGLLFFMQILIAVFVYFFLRMLLHRITGIAFKTQQKAHEYTVNSLIINHIITLSSFPLLLSYFYSNQVVFLYITMIIFMVLVAYSILRGGIVGLSITKFSGFYLFLYLCTLEILPIAIVVKLVILSTV